MIVNLEALFSERILALPVLLFSIVVHEFAHAYAAYRAGDTTAASQGRLTLNPLAHIDPIGTVLIPLFQFFGPQGLPLIGWAKPVPVNPLRFRSSEWDIFVSLAGPGSNFVLAAIAAVVLKVVVMLGAAFTPAMQPVFVVLMFFVAINVSLGVFNLIPIPPLDGSRVLYRILASARSPLADMYASLEQYGYFILILILVTPASRLFTGIVQFCLHLIMRFIF
jgi:Zn-dependent protease